MGCNDPRLWDKEKIEKYMDALNGMRATTAERKLREAMEALPNTFVFRPGIEQPVALMETDIAECHFITMEVLGLGRHLNRPMQAFDDGTLGGRSAGAIAKGMDETGGTVITVDIVETYKDIAEQYFFNEGVSDRIDFRIVPLVDGHGGSLAVLEELEKNPTRLGTFDFMFLDGAKPNYRRCYELGLALLAPGGKILMDNMLLSGLVTDLDCHEVNPEALREMNNLIMSDPRVNAILLDCFDGLMIVEKKGFDRHPRPSALPVPDGGI